MRMLVDSEIFLDTRVRSTLSEMEEEEEIEESSTRLRRRSDYSGLDQR